MKTIRTSREKIYNQLIFANIDKNLVAFMNLFALYKGINRTYLLRLILKEWYEKVITTESEEVIIDRMTEHLYKEWLAIRKVPRLRLQYRDFEAYLDQVEKELLNKRIDLLTAKAIINKLYEKDQERKQRNE